MAGIVPRLTGAFVRNLRSRQVGCGPYGGRPLAGVVGGLLDGAFTLRPTYDPGFKAIHGGCGCGPFLPELPEATPNQRRMSFLPLPLLAVNR